MPTKTKTPKSTVIQKIKFFVGQRVQHVSATELHGKICGIALASGTADIVWDVTDPENLPDNGWFSMKMIQPETEVPNTAEEVSCETKSPNAQRLQTIALDKIFPNPNQPRRNFAAQKLEELAQSIREHGVLQPPSIREIKPSGNHFQLIAGERRVRAAKLAGLTQIECLVRAATTQESAELAIVENRDRADIDPIEEAHAYKNLIDKFGVRVADVGEKAGKSRSAISNSMRLLQLPDSVQQMISSGTLSVAHGRALARWSQWPRFVDWYAGQITENEINVKGVELGFASHKISYEGENAARKAGIYDELDSWWHYETVMPKWVKEHGTVFVPKSDYQKRFICLDPELLHRLWDEHNVASSRQFNSSAPEKTAEEQKADATAERRETIANNKARRAAIQQIGSEIQAKIGRSDALLHSEPCADLVECALIVELVANALRGLEYQHRPFIQKLGQLHGIDDAWIEKFNGGHQPRALLLQLAQRRGLAWMVAFWGEVLLIQSLQHAVKDALPLPSNCKYFATQSGIDVPQAAE